MTNVFVVGVEKLFLCPDLNHWVMLYEFLVSFSSKSKDAIVNVWVKWFDSDTLSGICFFENVLVSLSILKISSILNYSSTDSSHPCITIHLMLCTYYGPMGRSLIWQREENSLKAHTKQPFRPPGANNKGISHLYIDLVVFPLSMSKCNE